MIIISGCFPFVPEKLNFRHRPQRINGNFDRLHDLWVSMQSAHPLGAQILPAAQPDRGGSIEPKVPGLQLARAVPVVW